MSERKKFELEFILTSSTRVLYNMLSTPSGLAEWFADDVNIRGDEYTFVWDGEEETARLLGRRNGDFVRFQWLGMDNERTYFEFRINEDPMTGEVALIITDFAEDSELENSRLLWNQHVGNLRQVIGSQA
jgi:uncharacterized protein YndB with AHSA1/START domain